MRIKISNTVIIDANEVCITPSGWEDENDDSRYRDMSCELTIRYGDIGIDEYSGEFNCSNATTFKECEEIAQPFLDELFKKGYIDISTEEKREKYGLTIY